MASLKKLTPLLNRVLIKKVVAPTKSGGGVLLPDSATASKVNTGKVVAVGPGKRGPDGNLIPVVVKEGDTVLLPEYGGNQMKLGEEEEYFLFRDDDLLGVIHE